MGDEHIHSAVQHMNAFGRKYPKAWGWLDKYRDFRNGLVNKDNPVAGYVHTTMSTVAGAMCVGVLGLEAASLSSNTSDLSVAVNRDIYRLSTFGAWRPSQGIYQLQPTLLRALADTPLKGAIPVEVLRFMPEWCVYVDMYDMPISAIDEHGKHPARLKGFWAHMTYMASAGDMLCITFDSGGEPPLCEFLPLRGETLDACMRLADKMTKGGGVHPPEVAALLGVCLSVLLYICTVNAEIKNADGSASQPSRPQAKPDKHGNMRMFAAKKPQVWLTGTRLGAALDAAHARQREEYERTGRTVMGHMRRAHYHGFWSGPREGERRFNLKWLPPIPVNLDDGEPPPVATVRPVHEST